MDAESINDNLKAICSTKKTELLFVALFIRMLKKGGRCACIVPDGVLFGSSNAHAALRKELVENHQLKAVISMPSGVFKPYAGVSTAILVFTKTGAGGTDKVWFYDMKADGFSLDDKRAAIAENDVPDIIERYASFTSLVKGRGTAEAVGGLSSEGEAAMGFDEYNRKRTDQSFFVDKADIVANNYDLSINRYKEVVYEQVEHDTPLEILARLDELSIDIASKMEELRGHIGG